MKYLKNSLVIIAIAVFAFASTAVYAGENEEKVIIAEKDTTQNNVVCYEVFGMDCPGCQSALEKQVKKIDGVANAKASFQEKQVIIEMKPGAKVLEEEIKERIEKANFTPGKKIKATGDEK